MKDVFVTGATGMLGSWLLHPLVADNQFGKVYVMARSSPGHSARKRVLRSLDAHANGTISRQAKRKIEVVEWDLSESSSGFSSRASMLFSKKQISDVFHTGALTDLEAPLSVLRRINVEGTRNLMEAALVAQRAGQPIRFHHISTLAVAGDFVGTFRESQLNSGQKFNNAYEQSKFESELVATAYRKKGLNVNVYRPSILTGDSRTGITINFKMFYQPLHFLAHELFRELPMTVSCTHSLVPVDLTAEAIYLLSKNNHVVNRTWHFVNPHRISLGDFVDIASKVLGFRKPRLIPLGAFPKEKLTPLQWRLVRPYVPYFNYKVRFEAERTNQTLHSLGLRWPEINFQFLGRLLRYCVRCGFISTK
jgi:thioester reductase-like protein